MYHNYRCPHCDYMPIVDPKVEQCNCPSSEICLGKEKCSQAKAFAEHLKTVHQKDWG